MKKIKLLWITHYRFHYMSLESDSGYWSAFKQGTEYQNTSVFTLIIHMLRDNVILKKTLVI